MSKIKEKWNISRRVEKKITQRICDVIDQWIVELVVRIDRFYSEFKLNKITEYSRVSISRKYTLQYELVIER